jgi:putative transposase
LTQADGWDNPLAMARQLRIQYDDAIYHLMSRGDRREEIFRNYLDRKSFLQTLGAACQKTGCQVHASCLMSNHFHLVVETPRANLVEGMKWLLGIPRRLEMGSWTHVSNLLHQ